MNKKILILLVAAVFASSSFIASANNVKNTELFTLGNAQKTYQDGAITCYLGHLFPGMPIYWCGYTKNDQFIMIHSYFANQVPQMNMEMSGASTSTYTVKE